MLAASSVRRAKQESMVGATTVSMAASQTLSVLRAKIAQTVGTAQTVQRVGPVDLAYDLLHQV